MHRSPPAAGNINSTAPLQLRGVCSPGVLSTPGRVAHRASAVVRTQLAALALDGVWQSLVKLKMSSPGCTDPIFWGNTCKRPPVFVGVGGSPVPETAAAFIRAEWVACALFTAGKAEASV